MEQTVKIDKRKMNKGEKGKVGAKKKPESEIKIGVSVYIRKCDVEALGRPRISALASDAVRKAIAETRIE